MEIKSIIYGDDLWQKTIDYAKNCTWKAGPFLAKKMIKNEFLDWERVFVAIDNKNIAGYCTFAKKDCIPDVEYTPYIGFIFVGEKYRGKRLSERMILYIMDYAKKLNLKKVYIVSDHINLYEKYGFIKIDEKEVNGMGMEKIYMKLIK
jgi:N-acetylglutamate synthase-like GNAT family acetyltransferase